MILVKIPEDFVLSVPMVNYNNAMNISQCPKYLTMYKGEIEISVHIPKISMVHISKISITEQYNARYIEKEEFKGKMLHL